MTFTLSATMAILASAILTFSAARAAMASTNAMTVIVTLVCMMVTAKNWTMVCRKYADTEADDQRAYKTEKLIHLISYQERGTSII
jgi:invasion protein IalB